MTEETYDIPKLDKSQIEYETIKIVRAICKKCRRNINNPGFDGCAYSNCPHGFEPCY